MSDSECQSKKQEKEEQNKDEAECETVNDEKPKDECDGVIGAIGVILLLN